jgi:hypothetical protein
VRDEPSVHNAQTLWTRRLLTERINQSEPSSPSTGIDQQLITIGTTIPHPADAAQTPTYDLDGVTAVAVIGLADHPRQAVRPSCPGGRATV